MVQIPEKPPFYRRLLRSRSRISVFKLTSQYEGHVVSCVWLLTSWTGNCKTRPGSLTQLSQDDRPGHMDDRGKVCNLCRCQCDSLERSCANEMEAPEGGTSALPVSSLLPYYTTVYFTLQLKYSHHKEIARAAHGRFPQYPVYEFLIRSL